MPQLAQAPQSAAAISAAHGGLMSIPRPGEKYNQDNFATGGIVAFSKGDRVKEEYETRYPTDEELAAFQAEAEQARGANTRPMFEQQNYRMNQGPSGGLPQIMDSPEAAVAPAVAAPTSTVDVETQKQLAKVKPAAAPAGPLAAMAQKAASDEFAQQGADLMKLPTRTPTNTTGLIDTPEEIAKDKEDILNSTIGYAGAEIMAGKSQFAMTNIGEGLSKAFASYAQRIGEHKKLRKSDIKDFATIALADEALKSGDIDRALRAWTHLDDNKVKVEIAEKQIGAQDRATTATRDATQAYRAEEQFRKNQIAIANDMKDWEALQVTPQGMIENSRMSQKNPKYVAEQRAAKMLELENRYRVNPSAGGDKDPLGLR